jgi:hypothetical protein
MSAHKPEEARELLAVPLLEWDVAGLADAAASAGAVQAG